MLNVARRAQRWSAMPNSGGGHNSGAILHAEVEEEWVQASGEMSYNHTKAPSAGE